MIRTKLHAFLDHFIYSKIQRRWLILILAKTRSWITIDSIGFTLGSTYLSFYKRHNNSLYNIWCIFHSFITFFLGLKRCIHEYDLGIILSLEYCKMIGWLWLKLVIFWPWYHFAKKIKKRKFKFLLKFSPKYLFKNHQFFPQLL